MLQQNLSLKRTLTGLVVAFYAVFYTRAVLNPASGIDYEDLAAAPWLKAIPLICTFAWLYAMRRLLAKFGASDAVAWAICGLTAASPTVLFLATHHTRHPLFALLATGALLALLSTRPIVSGILSALACIIQPAGIALVLVGIFTFAGRRRLRDAALFTVASMLLIAPVIGQKLAHGALASNVITHLHASEKAVVLGANAANLLQSPAAFVSGTRTFYGATVFTLLLLWALIKRRQVMPDLFVLVYLVVLSLRIWPPERFMILALPLLLWILWRGFRGMRAEILTAAVILLLGLEMFTTARQPRRDWAPIQKLFSYIRQETPPEAVIVSNLRETTAFNTGHRTVRGYRFDPWQFFYQPNVSVVTPDALGQAIQRSGASYVVILPDETRLESSSFRRSAEALERSGVLQPVAVPGLAPGYRLLSYVPIVGVVPTRNR